MQRTNVNLSQKFHTRSYPCDSKTPVYVTDLPIFMKLKDSLKGGGIYFEKEVVKKLVDLA